MGNPVDPINDKGSENHAAGNKVKFECSKDGHHTTQPTVEDEPHEAEPNLEPVMPEGDGVGEDEEEAADEKVTAPEVGTAPRKKKSKKKSKSKRGLNAPTGFEEFYVDAPVTPAEHEEERGLYHQSRPFSERIQTAIQRYFARRNLNSERKDVFDKYMAHGGIDAGPKMFSGGLDTKALAEMDADQIKTMNATHFVSVDRGGPDDTEFVVDFEGCTKAFLSSRMPSLYELHSEEKIQAYTAIIRNFLNYLLHHDVCPEHRDDVNAARAVCDRASTELWEIACAYELMPGTFHRACSVLFGGFYQNTYIGDQEWAQDFDVFKGMSPDEARNAFKFAFSSRTSMAMYERYKSQSASQTISMTSSINTGLEITHIAFADREVLKVYNKPEAAGLKPPGTMKARTWYHPYVPDEDVTEEEEEAEAAGGAPKEIHEYEFWVDNELLQRCYPGMKFETTVHHLSFGLDFFDNVAAIYCSFFTTLPNEEMIGWKEPGPRLPMREKVRNPTDDTEGGHGVEEIE